MMSFTTADQLPPVNPGEVLMEDFIEGFDITQHKLAVSIGVPPATDQRDSAWQACHHC